MGLHCGVIKHESISEDYLAKLNAQFLQSWDIVQIAAARPKKQQRLVLRAFTYLLALDRVKEGWEKVAIEAELNSRLCRP